MSKSNTFTTRNQFGALFQLYNRLGRGAEIGVRYGLFSRTLAKYYKGTILCVDKWEDREIEEVSTVVLESEQFHRWKGDSISVASVTGFESLDFVYLDAGHEYENIKADFEAWYTKVRPGGIIAGHDYGHDNEFPGVKKYIDELINNGLEVNFTTDDIWEGKNYQSWWIIK